MVVPGTEVVARYLHAHAYARAVFMIVNALLRAYDLKSIQTGGVTSYPLFIMVIAALEAEAPVVTDLPSALMAVLRFWAEFDASKFGLAIDPLTVIRKTSAPAKSMQEADEIVVGQDKMRILLKEQPYLLCLQDPGDPLNDLGKRSFRILHVRKLFSVVNWHMARWLSGKIQNPGSLAQLIFGDTLRPFQERRSQVLNWMLGGGRGVAVEELKYGTSHLRLTEPHM